MNRSEELVSAVAGLLNAWNQNYQAIPDQLEDALCSLSTTFKGFRLTSWNDELQEAILASMPVGRQAVLRRLRLSPAGLTDEDLYLLLQGTMTAGQVKSRRKELVDMGLVCKRESSGGNATASKAHNVWQAT